MVFELHPVSASMRGAWKSCQRKVFYRYVAAVEPTKQRSPARAIGKAFHLGVELWRAKAPDADPLLRAMALLDESLAKMGYEQEVRQLECMRLSAYLTGYFERFQKDLHLVGRRQLEMRLEARGELGFVDCVFTDEFGKHWIWEEKTTSQLSPDLPWVLSMDEQLLTYALMLGERGMPVAGAVYRQTLKSRKEPLKSKGETMAAFGARLRGEYRDESARLYRELRVTFDPAELAIYQRDRSETNAEIQSKLLGCKTVDGFRRNTHECIGKFGACDYLALCSRRNGIVKDDFKPNGKDPLDYGEFQRSIWGEFDRGAVAGTGSGEAEARPGGEDDDAWAYED